ncbi:MAG TPA: PepSY-associated TM helix domain-containing protein [Bacteroidales bacterium]|nr:PepSY-associated TM helix domain-containing protein [Bacteroidales bacterium]
MAKYSWRKWFRVIHRDFGYLFFGVTLIYAISGIAINHLDDWNPNYIITREYVKTDLAYGASKADILNMLDQFGEKKRFKNYYFPDSENLKIFLKDGNVYVNLNTGDALIETNRRRAIFREMNYLHYNPIKWWTWFSDLYAGALIALGITGIFIVRGKKGITGRGAWLTILGIVIPIIYLFIYYY